MDKCVWIINAFFKQLFRLAPKRIMKRVVGQNLNHAGKTLLEQPGKNHSVIIPGLQMVFMEMIEPFFQKGRSGPRQNHPVAKTNPKFFPDRAIVMQKRSQRLFRNGVDIQINAAMLLENFQAQKIGFVRVVLQFSAQGCVHWPDPFQFFRNGLINSQYLP